MNQTMLALAGFGLFFTGLHLLAGSIQPLVGKKMRQFLASVSRGSVSKALAGSLLGALTQSTTAAAFVCIGLLNSRALPFATILGLIAWSSVGTSLLVFIAAVDVRVVGFYVIGLVGVAHLFNAGRMLVARQIIAFLFALGVLLIGLGMVKEISAGLHQSVWVQEFMVFAAQAALINFIIGVLVTLITQSSASVTILIVTFCAAGILPFTDATLMVLGSSIGSGFSVVLATSHLNARQRQLAFYQCLVKFAGVLAFVPLAWAAQYWISAEQLRVLAEIPIATRIALVYLLLQVSGAFVTTIFQGQLMPILDRLCPIDQDNGLEEPRYIYDEAAQDADTAVILATREQDRLLQILADFLDTKRSNGGPATNRIPAAELHHASRQLAEKIKDFMEETALKNQSDEAIQNIFALQSRNEAIISLLDSLHSFVSTLQNSGPQTEGSSASMVESLHFILELLRDTVANDEDPDMLLMLTSDRGQLMEKIRAAVLEDTSLQLGERQALFICTSVFERIIWLLRQIALTRFAANDSTPEPLSSL